MMGQTGDLMTEFDDNNLFNVVFGSFFEVMVKWTCKFVEEADLLAVLQKAGGCRGLVCDGRKPSVHYFHHLHHVQVQYQLHPNI